MRHSICMAIDILLITAVFIIGFIAASSIHNPKNYRPFVDNDKVYIVFPDGNVHEYELEGIINE